MSTDDIDMDEIEEVAESFDMEVQEFAEAAQSPVFRMQGTLIHSARDAVDEGVDYLDVADAINEVQNAMLSEAVETGEFGDELADDTVDDEFIHHMAVILATKKAAERGVPDDKIIQNLNTTIQSFVNSDDFATFCE